MQSAWLMVSVPAKQHGNPRLPIRYTTRTIPAQEQQYKIVLLHARHKLRALLICLCTIKQISRNTSIWFVSDL